MVRAIIVGVSLIVGSTLLAQNEGKMMVMQPMSYIQPGMINASATFSPSMMLNRSTTNYYLSGFAEYHMSSKVSVRSDNFFLTSASEELFFDNAFRSYIGAFYHFRKSQWSNWDKYIGIQPGICYSARNPYGDDIQTFALLEAEYRLSPSMAITAGTSFYVWKYFNFFANLTYVKSTLSGVQGGPFKTDELIFSAGLGFQIQTKKNSIR